MPEREDCRATLDGLASDVRDAGGAAHVLRVEEPEGRTLPTCLIAAKTMRPSWVKSYKRGMC
ncbi:hypothetical protein ULG90_17300 [Halopseudomonas pachastrellae]|nr:hypothetical protein ULG90_17300 [Halopseudomonas pachastrellae]